MPRINRPPWLGGGVATLANAQMSWPGSNSIYTRLSAKTLRGTGSPEGHSPVITGPKNAGRSTGNGAPSEVKLVVG